MATQPARRAILKVAAAVLCAGGPGAALFAPLTKPAAADEAADVFGEAVPFSRAALMAEAEELAASDYRDRRQDLPEELRGMSIEAYQAIRPGAPFPHPLSADGRYRFDALPAGFVFDHPVDLFVVEGGSARRLRPDPALFAIDTPAEELTAGTGGLPFSGFRLYSEFVTPGAFDAFAVFQGASYFRAIGHGETYGLSARGLAINTGEPTGEEFPVFTAFYIEAPHREAEAVVVHALLDTPSTTGAYRITVRPGDATVTDVELTLFPRRELTAVGFAPFSSMFLFNGINRHAFDDYRRAVHKSDGLSILKGNGEWIWRPLSNRDRLQASAFFDTTPRGFGLIQRKRSYEDFLDAHADFESRPSAWVEPIGDWGAGAVVLFEIPTRYETNDNIVAYWRPDRLLVPGEPFSLTYRVHWDSEVPVSAKGPRVAATRAGRNADGSHPLFVIDFDVGEQQSGAADLTVDASEGRVLNIAHAGTPTPGILRVSFELQPEGAAVVELRVNLTLEGLPPAETWLFRWTA